ncbi:MAG: DHH family phosphoesterase [Methanomassiliicoccaceae archaeon]|nr:DHH family phosphoesterase [Methanomassiliicoccaceae archaeon]
MDDDVPPKLFSRLSSAADVVRAHDNVHIYSHHDADGISAAVILAKTMMRAGKGFKLTLFNSLNNDTVDEVRNCSAKCIIIADMGASYLMELDEIDADVIVLDHHKGEAGIARLHYINPHSFGIDGMSGGCGASMAMLFSAAMSDENWDLVQMAFAGVVGDKQHIKGLSGVNVYLFEEGNKRGYVTKADGSLIPSGQLMSSLFLTTEPYIRGVSGDVDGVSALLDDANIDASKSFSDLTDAEKRKLSSLITARLLGQGVTAETMDELVSNRYILRNWNIDAEEFAYLFNSCGRSGAGGIGIGSGLGDKKCMSEAMIINEASRKQVLSAVKDLDSKLEQMENIQFFENSESGFTGILCEIAMRFIGDKNKPIIGYNVTEGKTKVSSRCTHHILDRGVDLSVAMKTSAEKVGGGGGGHRIASGAWFPPGNEKEFLKTLDDIIGTQISAR